MWHLLYELYAWQFYLGNEYEVNSNEENSNIEVNLENLKKINSQGKNDEPSGSRVMDVVNTVAV